MGASNLRSEGDFLMNRKTTFVSLCCGLAVLAGLFPASAQGQRMPVRPGVAGPGGTVPLPYTVADNAGNQWRVYQYGQLQQSGNNPLYSQGAMLHINGNQPMVQNNMGRLDEKTGELILENMQMNGLSIT